MSATTAAAGRLTLADRLEIQELIARFAHGSDYGDWGALRGLYTPDVVTETVGLPIRYDGIEAQLEHARISAEQTGGKNRHLYFNLVLEPDGDAVIAHYCVVNVNAGAKPMEARIVVTGRMRDRVVKTADGWRIAHRTFSPDQSFDLDW